MIRFSLTTLLLVAFWIAALILVLAWRESWMPAGELPSGKIVPDIQPPCGRSLSASSDTIYVFNAEGVRLCAINVKLTRADRAELSDALKRDVWQVTHSLAGFLNPDTIVFRLKHRDAVLVYSRRFPEWWWGHFYRPEVWLALALTGLLIWRGAKSWNARRLIPAKVT